MVLCNRALALFGYDKAADELEALALVGPTGPVQFRSRTTVGQGLSGWVAASRQTILNSDPRLDFGNSVPELTAGLASAASIPLCIEDQLVGVLTIYSSTPAGYTEQHIKLLHVLAPRLATALASSRTFDEHATAHLWDSDTGLPNDRYLRGISRHLFPGIKYPLILLIRPPRLKAGRSPAENRGRADGSGRPTPRGLGFPPPGDDTLHP